MSKIRRTNQGGSAIVFVIVGVILTIGLVGAVYFAVQRGELARKEQAIAAYDKEQADKKAAEESNSSNQTNSSTDESSNVNTTEVAVSTSELPVTGPEFILSQLIGAGLITVTVASYLLSRRS